jgi:tetratricopeptide (TPR) repeat protein
MAVRTELEEVCRKKRIDPNAVREGHGDRIRGIAITAAKACRSIGRDAEARAREAEIAQLTPASPGASDAPRPTPPAAEAKAVEAPHQNAGQPETFAAALAEAQRQPETPEGAEAAVASYRRAIQAGALDEAQLAQFALRLRAHGRALLTKRDYDGAICALEEAKLRDPKLDVAADLAAVRTAEHPRDRSKPPTGGSGDPDALEPITRVDLETRETYPEYRNRRGCTVSRGRQP